ncbi:glycoside hydrolase family 99-like domain-containing protein [Reyranella sp. CPCC 100927]|uniref:glycoside hydrolase family 99-like domain-containing protein n=1 Tax=Reyranella sp. CPCC 100927 TaxID=2599616 RepID=UPI0011B78189|nr:glycoside hydrolase family 99-like domain-containing protein [Reyranella sp. CPCC 100927]TWT12890.1 glycosyltransferase [Reyranella sp. CPCC 100927]
MNLCFVAHCNFRGNSAMHVFSLATELTKLGHECVIVVPDSPETVHEHGEPSFGVLDYETAWKKGIAFSNTQGPDLVHAWTPREHVRQITTKMTRRYRCRHVVHMEDNEEQVVRDELRGFSDTDILSLPHDVIDGLIGPHRSHPYRYRRFMEAAAGYSCLIDNLLEFKPADVPGMVFWPGFDTPFENVSAEDRRARAKYGIDERDIVILYSGNVHPSIATDIQKLYATVGLLRHYGLPVKLVRTGWTYASLGFADAADLSDYVIDLGFAPRADIPVLVGMSDILIQPGRSDPFNDYRFPSKLPEYLVSGRPVILPDTNIGKALEDGKHVLKLYDGSIAELLRAVRALIESPSLGQELGRNARAFAQRFLTWPRAAAALDELYRRIPASPPATAVPGDELSRKASDRSVYGEEATTDHGNTTAKALPLVRFPVKLIAFRHPHSRQGDRVGQQTTTNPLVMHEETSLAREHGIHGFCFHEWAHADRGSEDDSLLGEWISAQGLDFPFCVCWNLEPDPAIDRSGTITTAPWFERQFVERLLPILDDRRYIRVDGAPLLLVRDSAPARDRVGATQAWRQLARDHGIDRLHLCAIESIGTRCQRPLGFDAAVEAPSAGGSKLPSATWSNDYIAVALRSMNQPPIDHVRYRCVLPPGDGVRDNMVDPRLINDSPKAYGQWLRYGVREAMRRRQQQEPLVFIDGWNQGAIGTCLQPNGRHDRSLLKVTYDALSEGIIDCGRGPTPEREREFAARIARLA